LLWTCGGFNPELKQNWPTVASLVVAGDVAVVPFGRADRGQPRLHGIKLGALPASASDSPTASASGSGEHAGGAGASAGERIWKREDTGTFVPTPAVYQGRVYILRDRGEVECLDPATGKTLWSAAFPKASANFYASPLIAGGKLYAAREDGVVFVANVGGKFELLAENKTGERVIASPVAVSRRLFIRGEQHLFCVAGPD
jgi:outer membrane protein assembly factor BamB